MTRVLVVDDHPIFRQGLRLVLEGPDIEWVGEAADGAGGASSRSWRPTSS